MQLWARFFDGESGQGLDVGLHIDRVAETLRLSHPDLPRGSQYWPLRAIRALSDHARADQLVLSLYDDGALDSALIKTARLVVSDPTVIEDLRNTCPNLKRRDYLPGTGRRIAIWSTGALASFVLLFFVILPGLANTLAGFIPVEREVAYGKAVVNQMERFMGGQTQGALLCRDADGLEALAAMEDRLLASTDTLYDLNVVVFDHPMVNAFAAPGGQIVIMRGLIDKAGSADEVAAVLAHEIGHVERRDVTRNALRTAGSAGVLSMILGDFTGGTLMLIVTEQILNAAYTREAEAEADVYAMNMLEAARVDVRAMGDFFDSLSALESKGPSLPSYLQSHPETSGRADAARDFARDQSGTRSILSDSEWKALRGVCS